MMKKFLPLLLLLGMLVGCSKKEASTSPNAKPRVLVSIAPYAYFVGRIAKETVSIQNLVPLGANPHMFEPSPREVQQAYGGALWIRIGEPFEEKIATVLKEQNPKLSVVEIWKEVTLLTLDEDEEELCQHGHHHHEDAKDRHIWLSLRLAKAQATRIEEELVRLLPAHRAFYEKNLQQFLEDLDKLDEEFSALFTPLQGSAILVSHPAFGYFCHDYKLVQLSVECEGKDPLPQDVSRILQRAEEAHVQSALVQTSYNNKGTELIAEKLEIPIYSIDPYSGDYLNNMRYLAQTILHTCPKK